MAHINKLKFIKINDLVDEDYCLVGVPTYSDEMDDDLAGLFKSQNKKGNVGDLVFEITEECRIAYFGLGKFEERTPEDFRRAAGTLINHAIKNDFKNECNRRFN